MCEKKNKETNENYQTKLYTYQEKMKRSHDQYYDREKKILHLLGTGTIPILKNIKHSSELNK